MIKYVKHALGLFAVALFFYACQKEVSSEKETNVLTAMQWQFKEAGIDFKGLVDTAYIDTILGMKYLSILGKSHNKKDNIQLHVSAENLKPGVYKSPMAFMLYERNNEIVYQPYLQEFGSFSITITKMDTAGIAGTFTGKVANSVNIVKILTAGNFYAKFKNSVVTAPTKDSGQVTLWSKSGCSGGTSSTPITVFIDNKTGQINSFHPNTAPNCGAIGTYTVKLPVGSYTWKAKCGKDTITGLVSIAKNICIKEQVDFSAPPPPPVDSGQVTLWSKSGCNASNTAITVTVNNKNGQITTFSPTEPTVCGIAGNAYFKLPVGSYTWKAFCGLDSIAGQVTIAKSYCSKVQVVFSSLQPPPSGGDYFPTTKNSYWEYAEPGSTSNSSIITSTGNTKVFSNKLYTIFEDDNGGDPSYYRKENGTYYQYYTAAFPYQLFDKPTPIEYTFLDQNLPIGGTWSTPTVSGTSGGIATSITLKFTILDKVVTATVGNNTFNNVIKVRMSYWVSFFNIQATEQYRFEYWYAKDIGLIKERVYVRPFIDAGIMNDLVKWKIN